jgi:asparagine synthase (glutamine-hydrolysing)
MCGIVTIVTPAGTTVSSKTLEAMTSRLVHRGPDDFGYASVDPQSRKSETWTQPMGTRTLAGVSFGCRRLSIVDPTLGGHQPMLSDDRSTVLAFNGEIYNYVELRRELQQLGMTFRSRSDTEVLLKAYEHWGTDAFARFNGMWAFTLWDGHQRRVIACRDRFGVKPLYYSTISGIWIFASEIKALLAFPGAFRGFRDENIVRFVDHNAIDGDESTMFRDIWALSPATYLELRAEKASHRRYWTLTIDGRHDRQSREELVDRYRELLTDSVRLRVRSDVPIGTMLSGGLDSTSITALICELSSFHHTFTACWPGWAGDEEATVRVICEDRGLDSHKVYLTSHGMRDVLDKVVYHLDEPFVNPTSLVQYLLMDQARKYGIKVVLNGHGSDEALAGYDRFLPPFLAQLLLSGHPLAFLKNYRMFRQNMRFANRRILESFMLGVRRLFGRAGMLADLPANYQLSVQARTVPYNQRADALHGASNLSLLGAELWEAFSTRTLPMWLRMEDRMSMAHSIESRLPFLDYRLIEMAFNLPDDLKNNNGFTKVVLREAMKNRLPASIALNRKKTRFSAPFEEWLRKEWRPILEDNLLCSCRLDGHMDTDRFKRRLKAFLAGEGKVLKAQVVWRALNTERFLAAFSGADTIAR